ncbi:MAG: PaaI family thioesterase [Chloroflexi bacterium]|nr:MAG: PaaI family thioesterase [Chloroflexota bacterium]
MPSRAGGDRGTAVGASAAVRRAFVVTRLIDRFNAMVGGDAPGSAVGRLVGFRPTSIEPGKAIFELEAGPQHANPMGTLHGGIICDVADAAMGTAYASTLGDGESFTTLELKINFLRPFWSGRLVVTAHTVRAGRTIGLVECDVTDVDGKLVARAMSTCMTLRGESSEGR